MPIKNNGVRISIQFGFNSQAAKFNFTRGIRFAGFNTKNEQIKKNIKDYLEKNTLSLFTKIQDASNLVMRITAAEKIDHKPKRLYREVDNPECPISEKRKKRGRNGKSKFTEQYKLFWSSKWNDVYSVLKSFKLSQVENKSSHSFSKRITDFSVGAFLYFSSFAQ